MVTSLFAKEVLTFASDEWVNQTQSDGKGTYYDLIRAIYGDQYNIKFIRSPWSRVSAQFRKGEYDGLIGEVKFDKEMIHPIDPIDQTELTAFYLKKFKFINIESLKAARLMWVRSYYFDSMIPFKVDFVEVGSPDEGFDLLLKDRADVFIDYESDFEYNCKKGRLDCSPIKFSGAGFSEKAFVAFHNTEKGKKLVEIYNKKMISLKANKEIFKIFKKYGATYKPVK